MQSFLEQLKEWQTLTGALIALGAAFVTVRVMRSNTSRQLKEQRSEAESQRRRRLRACRAVMPADLSAIVQYAESCAELSTTMHRVVSEDGQRQNLECPALPERLIANLQLLIEQLDDEKADAVADMLSCYQVQRARMSGLIETYNHPHRFGRHQLLTVDNVEFTFEQTVELHLRATGAFGFARRRADEIQVCPFTEDVIASSLSNLELTDVLSPDYRAFLLRVYSSPTRQEE